MATRSAITQLRNNLQDVEDTDKLIQDDFYLAVWLNLKNSDVGKAEAAIRDALTWWNANASSLTQETIPPGLSNKFPLFFHEIGKDGLPVAYVRLTTLDWRGLVSDSKIPDAARYTLKNVVIAQRTVLEINRLRQIKLGDEALKSARGHVAILDFYGVTRRNMPPIKSVNILIQTYREAVKIPVSARTLYIIGVSGFLRVLLRPLIPIFHGFGVTVKAYGADEKIWETDLCQIIDSKMLEELRDRASKATNENTKSDDHKPGASSWLPSGWITGW